MILSVLPRRNAEGGFEYFGPKSREQQEVKDTPGVDVLLFRHSQRFAGQQEWRDQNLAGLPESKMAVDDGKELRPEGEVLAEETGRILKQGQYDEVVGYNTPENRTGVTERKLAKGIMGYENDPETLKNSLYAVVRKYGDAELKKAFDEALERAKANLSRISASYGLEDKRRRGELGETAENEAFTVKLLENPKVVDGIARMMSVHLLMLRDQAEGRLNGGLTGRVALPFVNHGGLTEGLLLKVLRRGGKAISSIHELGGLFNTMEGFKISFQKKDGVDRQVCEFLNPKRQAMMGKGVELTIDWAEVETLAAAFKEGTKPVPPKPKEEPKKEEPAKPAAPAHGGHGGGHGGHH